MLILTRVFCVLLYARVRLSDTAFETHLWSTELRLEIQVWIQIPAFPVDWFREAICCIGDFTAFELFMLYFSNSDIYSGFMNYDSLSFPLHYITL